jgi:hypothetical protein
MPAGGDDHELVTACNIGHRRRLAASRQRRLPQFAASVDVEGTQLVVPRRGNETRIPRMKPRFWARLRRFWAKIQQLAGDRMGWRWGTRRVKQTTAR